MDGNMTELGSGLYRLNTSKITVEPSEPPVKLNMTITRSGYTSLYHVEYVTVALDELVKEESTDGDDEEDDAEEPNIPGFEPISLFGLTLFAIVGLIFLVRKHLVIKP